MTNKELNLNLIDKRVCRLIDKGNKVSLRGRKKSGEARESLYLDYYFEGKRYREALVLYLKSEKNLIDKNENKETLKSAKYLRAKKETELFTGNVKLPQKKSDADLIKFFEIFLTNYSKKDKRLLIACFKRLLKFTGRTSISCTEVTPNFVRRFKEHLESKYNGETPFNYFKKFKKVIKAAMEYELFEKDPTLGIIIKKNEGIKKEILLMDEIQKLANAECKNISIKKAFLFSCCTGLRFCDIKVLTWNSISGDIIRIVQQKTKQIARINLNETASVMIC